MPLKLGPSFIEGSTGVIRTLYINSCLLFHISSSYRPTDKKPRAHTAVLKVACETNNHYSRLIIGFAQHYEIDESGRCDRMAGRYRDWLRRNGVTIHSRKARIEEEKVAVKKASSFAAPPYRPVATRSFLRLHHSSTS